MNTVIRVGAEPEKFSAPAHYLDGDHAAPQDATLGIDETAQTLVITCDSGQVYRWPLGAIRQVPDQAGGDIMVLRLRDDPVARLILAEKLLTVRLPNLKKRAPITKRGRLITWAVAAIASVALIIGVLVPLMADQLAEYIPPDGERALGETTLGQIREAMDDSGLAPVGLCENGEGLLALRKMEARLTDQLNLDQELSVHVLNHDMVNAFALPGGYIVFFRGLIDAAEDPEEVAAVFAHEIGHVVSRDPTRHALRSAGSIGVLGLLFGDFAGGAAVLFLTERLIQAQYSQDAETQADIFAYDVLTKAKLPPGSLADMFERLRALGGEPDGIVAHFLSHPALRDRILAAREASQGIEIGDPVLTSSEWAALKRICE